MRDDPNHVLVAFIEGSDSRFCAFDGQREGVHHNKCVVLELACLRARARTTAVRGGQIGRCIRVENKERFGVAVRGECDVVGLLPTFQRSALRTTRRRGRDQVEWYGEGL